MPASSPIETIRTVRDLRRWVTSCRGRGLTVGLVPTMGALHEGHLALVRRSTDEMDRTVASLFVNPRQFGPNEDLASYPRTEDADAGMLAAAGAHLLYAPDVAEMYPPGEDAPVLVPGLGDVLEGAFRPGFFDGVATVVAKLFEQVTPDRAYFGEKDYQQLLVVRAMAKQQNLKVEVVGCATVRASDGLALSSRNAYLTPAERAVAPHLYAALNRVADHVAGGGDGDVARDAAHVALLDAGFAGVDYIAVCDGETLGPVVYPWDGGRPVRVLGAAHLGRARLIDNVAVLPSGGNR